MVNGATGAAGPAGATGTTGATSHQGPARAIDGHASGDVTGPIVISYPQRGAPMSTRGVVFITVRCGASVGQFVLGAAAPAPRKLTAGLAARPGVVPRARWPFTEDRGAARRQRAEPRALTRADRLDRLRHARGRRGNDPHGGEHADQRRIARPRTDAPSACEDGAHVRLRSRTCSTRRRRSRPRRRESRRALRRRPIESEHIGVTHMRYAPDTRSPMAHSHREQEEVYIVVSGSGKAKLDDETAVDLKTWDIVRSHRRRCARSTAARTGSSCSRSAPTAPKAGRRPGTGRLLGGLNAPRFDMRVHGHPWLALSIRKEQP